MLTSKEKALIELHEGRKLVPYKDSLGYWTIGVGHYLSNPPDPEYKLTDKECDTLLEEDWKEHSDLVFKTLPWAKELDEVRQYVLKDMCFNLGNKLFKWPIFLKQIQDKKYAAAADNMIHTLWAKQVKSRAFRLSRMMETGTWPSGLGT